MSSSPESSPDVIHSPSSNNNPSQLFSLNAGTQISSKLSGPNYPIWRVQFNALLVGYGLMGYVDGSLSCPTKFLDAANTKLNPAYTFWMRQDQLIVLAIVSSVTDTVITMLGGVTTSKDAWDVLKTMYANCSVSRILSLKDKLSRFSKGDLSISTYMNQIKALSDELAIIDQPLVNTDLILYILNGLGPDYHEVTVAIRAHNVPIQFEELHDKLTDFEIYLIER